MIETTTTLNRIGAELGKDKDVHAVTDVTGFGVLGHALELARGSRLSIVLQADEVPLLQEAAMLSEKGFVTGASHRNWASYGHDVVLPADMPEWKRHLLSDPQTSGGLLVSCAADRAASILQTVKAAGFPAARIIGKTESGKPSIKVV
jgi:selenide,water dikinase